MKKIVNLVLMLVPAMLVPVIVYSHESDLEQLVNLHFDKELILRAVQMAVEKGLQMRNLAVSQELIDEICAKITDRLLSDERKQLQADILAEHFDSSEITQMLALYKSDLGKKVLQKMPEMLLGGMQYESQAVQEIMQEYRERLAEFEEQDPSSSSASVPSSSSSSDEDDDIEAGGNRNGDVADDATVKIKVTFAGPLKTLGRLFRRF